MQQPWAQDDSFTADVTVDTLPCNQPQQVHSYSTETIALTQRLTGSRFTSLLHAITKTTTHCSEAWYQAPDWPVAVHAPVPRNGSNSEANEERKEPACATGTC
jgi:hypothetical protein